MADKKLAVSIGGQDVTCNFGVNYFYKHYRDATGRDLLKEGMDGLGSTDSFDIIGGIYFAGYLAECSIKKQDPALKLVDFTDHVLSAETELAVTWLTDYMNLVNPKPDTPGEAAPHPKEQS